jgi:hypothetical protein
MEVWEVSEVYFDMAPSNWQAWDLEADASLKVVKIVLDHPLR